MTLPEIFVQLPEEIQIALERRLELAEIPTNPTMGEVYDITELISNDLSFEYSCVTPEVRVLLDKVPQAIVDTIFRS